MKITILSQRSKVNTINYYPHIYNKLSKKFNLQFINVKSKKNFNLLKNIIFFYNYFKKNRNPVIFNITETNRYFIYLIFIKFFDIPLFYLHAQQNFTLSTYNKDIGTIKKITLYIINLDKKLYNFLIYINIYKRINILFASNNEEILYWKKKYKFFFGFKIQLNKFEKFVKIKDKSFDEYSKKNISKKKNYVTFIDNALPYHKDQVYFGYKPIDKKYYFENIFKIFNLIKKLYNLEIHILAHPKYQNEIKNDYKGFKVKKSFSEKNKSLINCKFVLLHHSAAIFKAINFEKPIIQISSKKFNNFIKNYDNFFKRKFKLDRIYLEENSDNNIKRIIKRNLQNKSIKNKFDIKLNNYEIFCKEAINYYEK